MFRNNWLGVAFLFLIFIVPDYGQQDIHIAIINETVSSDSEIDWFQEEIKEEISVLINNRYNVIFSEYHGSYNENLIKQKISEIYSNPEIDIIVGLGSMSGGILSSRANFPIPTIAGIIIDHELQNVPLTTANTSGIENFTYIMSPFDIERDLNTLYRLRPYKQLVVVGGNNLMSYLPFLQKMVADILLPLNAEFEIIPYQGSVERTISSIDDHVDAIYELPTFDEMTASEQRDFHEQLNLRGLPIMAMLGEFQISFGALMGYEADPNLRRVPRRIALNIQKILEGRNASDLNVIIPTYNETLLINIGAARVSGVYPDFELMSDAVLMNLSEVRTDRSINLLSAMAEALENNLDLLVASYNPEISDKDIRLAQSNLGPQLDMSTSFSYLDNTSAERGFGTIGRNNINGGLSMTQLILSEPAMANVAIRRLLQKSAHADLDGVQLDIILETAEAYLNILQAKSALTIQNENVLVTKENFDIAKAKESVGYSGVSDLNRWTSELALKNIELNDALALHNQSKFRLNQILNRPISEEFHIEDIGLNEQITTLFDPRIFGLVRNYGDLIIFTEFMVNEAFDRLPALKSLDYNIEAQERQRLSNERTLYIPSVAFSGALDHTIQKFNLPENVIGVNADPTWNLGIGVKYSIFQSGYRKNLLQQSKISIKQLEASKNNIRNQLELGVRSSFENLSSSYPRLELSQQAATAAQSNFDIIQDSYSQGLTGITALIDAQNSALSTRLNAINAVYTFVLDWLKVERSLGFFHFASSEDENEELFERFNSYFKKKKNSND